MKKLKRLIELKRLTKLNELKRQRVEAKAKSLENERKKILDSITQEEWRLYSDRIERACKL